MNDAVVEVLIKRKATIATYVIWFGLAFVAIISMFFAIMHSIFWPFVILVFMIEYFIYKRTNLEYEYLMVNETIVIDKIINKQKRKRVIRFDMRKFELVAPAGHEELKKYNKISILNCSSDDRTHRIYIGILRSEDKAVRLLFEPNDKMLNYMRLLLGKKAILEK